jgi:hypothetical protein
MRAFEEPHQGASVGEAKADAQRRATAISQQHTFRVEVALAATNLTITQHIVGRQSRTANGTFRRSPMRWLHC